MHVTFSPAFFSRFVKTRTSNFRKVVWQHSEGMVESITWICWKFTWLSSSEVFWKSVKNWQSYRHEFGVLLFWDTVYSFQKMIPIWMRYKRLSENYIFLVSVFMRLAQTPSCFISSPQSELQWIESPRRFLPRDAIQARPMPSCSVCVCVCVCLSVCHVRGSCQNE